MIRAPQNVLEGLGFAANSALGLGRGLKDAIRAMVRDKVHQQLAKIDLVTREEYEELRLMVEKLRQEQEERSNPGTE
ncbi:MAG: accessory factor UbiK family protein [Alphaproteobacteria bacterium]|nr:accessory factor UbiK family protein [Alphaproteobacteria bacterium]